MDELNDEIEIQNDIIYEEKEEESDEESGEREDSYKKNSKNKNKREESEIINNDIRNINNNIEKDNTNIGSVLDIPLIKSSLFDINVSTDNNKHYYSKLIVDNKNIVDISILRNYPNLQTISLFNNKIKDISVLSNHKQLRSLNVSQNNIDTFLEISNIRCLQEVNISYNNIEYLTNTSEFKYLNKLIIEGNKLINLNGVENLISLTLLDASNNMIDIAENIENLPLKELYLQGNKIKSANFGILKYLDVLNISNNSITTLNGLCAPFLSVLICCNNFIHNLSQIEECKLLPRLAQLDLRGNDLCDIENYRCHVLHLLPNLEFLDGQEVTFDEKIAANEFYGQYQQVRDAIRDRYLPGAECSTLEGYLQEYPELSDTTEKERKFWLKLVDYGFFEDWETLLTELRDQNRIKLSSSQSIVQTFPLLDDIVSLDFSNLPLGDIGYYFVAQILDELLNVTSLNLNSTKGNRWLKHDSHGFGLKVLCERLRYSNITNLSLKNNNIGLIELNVISKLLTRSSIETIDLSENYCGQHISRRIHGQDTTVEFCPSFKNLCLFLQESNLKSLDLSNNKLDENSVDSINELLISDTCYLEYLNLSNNDFGRGGIKIMSALKNNKYLKSFLYSGCSLLEKNQDIFSELGKNLKSHPLKMLDISNNYVGENGVISISNNLRSSNIEFLKLTNSTTGNSLSNLICKTLLTIDLSGTNSSSNNIDLFLNNLAESNLQGLNLNLNGVNRSEKTAELLVKTLDKLSHLSMKGGKLNQSFSTQDAYLIANALSTNSSLRYLDLSHNHFDASATTSIIQSCGIQGNLESLIIGSQNFIDADSFSAISHAVPLMKKLIIFDLSGASISGHNVKNAAEAKKAFDSFLNSTSIKHVNLSGFDLQFINNTSLINEEYPLASLLLAKLLTLNLSNCNLYSVTKLDNVLYSIGSKIAVKSLNLSNNRLMPETLSVIADCLRMNIDVISLNLSGNSATPSVMKVFADFVGNNKSLLQLYLPNLVNNALSNLPHVIQKFKSNNSTVELHIDKVSASSNFRNNIIQAIGPNPNSSLSFFHSIESSESVVELEDDLICNAYSSLLTKSRIKTQYNLTDGVLSLHKLGEDSISIGNLAANNIFTISKY